MVVARWGGGMGGVKGWRAGGRGAGGGVASGGGVGAGRAWEVRAGGVGARVGGPAVGGVNWTPSQQLVQGPVKVEVKAAVGGLPWPKRVSSTRMALKSGAELVAVSVVKGEVI